MIALKTKGVASACMMAMVAAALLIGEYAYWMMTLVLTTSILVLTFIWSRPSQV